MASAAASVVEAIAAVDQVVAQPTGEDVVVAFALEPVVVVAAEERVSILAAHDGVVFAATGENVVTVVPVDLVLAVGGISFLLDPSGALIGMSTDFIDGLFIPDYVLPGWILTIGFGIIPLVAVYGLWRRASWPQLEWLERWTGMHWSWVIALAVGLGQMLWVLIEFAMTSYFVLQPVMFAVGAVIVVLAMLPTVRARYRRATLGEPDT